MSANPYDVVSYPGHVRPPAHPRRLETNARLFGLPAPALDSCRVLELGCGDGVHLIWLAAELGGARCVGVDMAEGGLARGREIARRLGLRNVEFIRADIMDIGREFGEFDYLIAHGFYSWVPEPVRDRLLTVCSANLAPDGVAYVSYNTLPGCHLRRMLDEMMRFHVRAIEDPRQRVAEARRFAALLPDWSRAGDVYQAVLENEREFLARMSDPVMYHDDLAECNAPVYLTDFLGHAGRHGLQYLTEATLMEADRLDLWPELAAQIDHWVASRVEREQYFDFLTARRFRATLLCHAGQDLRERPDPQAVRQMAVAGQLNFDTESDLKNGDKDLEFQGCEDTVIALRDPVLKVALAYVASRWPGAVTFTELWEQVVGVMSPPVTRHEEAQSELCGTLLKCYQSGMLELSVTPARVASRAGDWPRASALARLQAAMGEPITSIRGQTIKIDDDFTRFFLQLLDGSRSRTKISAALIDAVSRGKVKPPPAKAGDWQGAIRAGLNNNLESLARLALLEA